MKKFKVIIEIFLGGNRNKIEEIIVEAGSKKLASIRALREISKKKEYENLYKTIRSIEDAV